MAALALNASSTRPLAVNGRGLLAAMALSVVGVATLAAWDEQREAAAALASLAEEQLRLADVVARVDGAAVDLDSPAARAVERAGEVVVLLRKGGDAMFHGRAGMTLPRSAIAPGAGQIDRDVAPTVGLPQRLAVTGVALLPEGSGEVAVIATAGAARDRERHARLRLLASVFVAAGLVLTFGGVAMRKQRREIELDHRLSLRDLEKTRDEQLRKADRLATMGALASGVAHEVATPLGVILARSEQLAARVDDERSRRAVRAIVEQTERIDAVVRGFLDLARGTRPVFRTEEPRRLVDEAVALVGHRFERSGVTLEVQVADGLPALRCEPLLLEHVLVNLLLNACDACRAGGRVVVTAEHDGGHLRFRVEDDGVGITLEQAARAKEPFFTTKAERGTGVGLAIAGEIVEHHRGRLTLAPRVGARGTVATVELPDDGGDGA